IVKNTLPPGNLYFDNTYAAMEETRRCPSVPMTVINAVLNMYRVNGTQVLPIKTNKSAKLSKVGLLTHSFGGNKNISSNGLNALLTAYSRGKIKNHPKINRTK